MSPHFKSVTINGVDYYKIFDYFIDSVNYGVGTKKCITIAVDNILHVTIDDNIIEFITNQKYSILLDYNNTRDASKAYHDYFGDDYDENDYRDGYSSA